MILSWGGDWWIVCEDYLHPGFQGGTITAERLAGEVQDLLQCNHTYCEGTRTFPIGFHAEASLAHKHDVLNLAARLAGCWIVLELLIDFIVDVIPMDAYPLEEMLAAPTASVRQFASAPSVQTLATSTLIP